MTGEALLDPTGCRVMGDCRVDVKLYAVLRELAGTSRVSLDFAGEPTVGELLARLWGGFPGLSRVYGGSSDVVVLLNGRPVSRDSLVPCGSEVHILPPAAGGAERVFVRVVEDGEKVSLDSIMELLSDDRMGAMLVFVGTVKSVVEGRGVTLLHYEAHEDLENVLRGIAREIHEKYGLAGVYVAHAVGDRRPGDITFVAAVKSYSRLNGFPALQELVERVKREAPIWKKEYREDGVYWIVGSKRISVGG